MAECRIGGRKKRTKGGIFTGKYLTLELSVYISSKIHLQHASHRIDGLE